MNDNVKARKLKRKDKVVIGGIKHEIVSLNLHFGGTSERVSISLTPAGDRPDFTKRITMSVPANHVFNVTRKTK
jgi:hypothetical protein